MHSVFSLGRSRPGRRSTSGSAGGANSRGGRGAGAPLAPGGGSNGQRRVRRRRGSGEEDPLGLDGELFEYVTHRQHHGEAFVAYRLLGRPMVLHSVEDGLPLASLHLRVAGRSSDAQALVVRRPDRGEGDFLGIITADNQEFELIMTNLTANDVLMFDIGGSPRAREAEFWERTEASFWSGSHRNDRRLNRSNILWPMTPNTCSENHLYFQDHQEHRRLVLRGRPSDAADAPMGSIDQTVDAKAQDFEGFPLFVYPKHGSRTAERFARTSWSCPETIMVIGTPSLLDSDFREGHNIQVERPQPTPGREGAEPLDQAGQAAASLGVGRDRLLQVLGIDDHFLQDLPAEVQREILMDAFRGADLSALEDEPPEQQPQERRAGQAGVGGSAAAQHLGSGPLALGARPAEVAAGRRLLGAGAPHSLLIEKFDFARRGADAVLSLGVRDDLQMMEPEDGALDAEAEALLLKSLDQLVATRTAELIEDARGKAVYATPECVVCMENFPPPDTVLYQCGHRCVHLKCVDSARLRRCPLCRSPIVAMLPHVGEASADADPAPL